MTVPGPVWTNSSTTSSYIPTTVSLGQHGAEVFSFIDGFSGCSRLFSSGDHTPAASVWQGPTSFSTQGTFVASAESTDLHVSLGLVQSTFGGPKSAVLSRYSGSSATPAWTYTFPVTIGNSEPLNVHVSRDGQTIVAWVFDPPTNKTNVAVFAADYPSANGVPLSYTALDLLTPPQFSQLTPDGSLMFFVSGLKRSVFDVHGSHEIYSALNDQHPPAGSAISGDGQLFVIGDLNGNARIYRRQGNTYNLWFNQSLNETTPTGISSAALSDDGSTLVLGWGYSTLFQNVRIQVLDLSTSGHPVMFDDMIQGGGSYQDWTTAIAMCANGSTCGVGLAGDQFGLAPEVLVYGRDAQSGAWSRVYQYDLPGSVQDMRISADGRYLAVASKAVHDNVLGGGGRVDLFQLGEHDLVLDGVPHAGSAVTVAQSLTPGVQTRFLRSTALLSAPIHYAGVGALFLDPTHMSVAGVAHAGADGIARLTVTVPGGSTMLGTSFYYQGLSTSPRRLSQDWVDLTILP